MNQKLLKCVGFLTTDKPMYNIMKTRLSYKHRIRMKKYTNIYPLWEINFVSRENRREKGGN